MFRALANAKRDGLPVFRQLEIDPFLRWRLSMERVDDCFLPLKYESLGRAVIPVGSGTDAKRPLVSWKQYQRQSPEADDILLWQEEFSRPNWAMVCGRVSGVVVLDCDSTAAAECVRKAGLEPAVTTPHGLHFYFSCGGSAIATITLETDGITFEVKGEKSLANFFGPGYSVSNRATNPDGLYPLAQLPLDLRASITRPARTPRKPPDAICEGERNATLFRSACRLRGMDMNSDGILAALRAENQAKCRPPLPDAEVRAISRSVSKYEPEVSLPEIVRGLARVSLPASSMRLYAVILDETIGRDKRENWLAYSQLGRATGLPQNEVWRGLKRLRESGMVKATKKGEQRLYSPTHPWEWCT